MNIGRVNSAAAPSGVQQIASQVPTVSCAGAWDVGQPFGAQRGCRYTDSLVPRKYSDPNEVSSVIESARGEILARLPHID